MKIYLPNNNSNMFLLVSQQQLPVVIMKSWEFGQGMNESKNTALVKMGTSYFLLLTDN